MVCLEPSFHISWWMPRDSFFSHLLHTMATDDSLGPTRVNYCSARTEGTQQEAPLVKF